MKIGIITPNNLIPPNSGALRRIYKIAETLNSCGANVSVLHNGSNISVTTGLRFLNFHSLNPIPASGNYFHPFNPFFSNIFADFMTKFNPDIIQCEGPWSIFPVILFTKKAHIPCVLDEHNVELLWSLHASKIPLLSVYISVIEKFALSSSDKILVTSENDKFVISKIFKIRTNKIFVVPNGVDLKIFSSLKPSSHLRNRLGISSKRKIVLFHGLMSAKQNYEAANLILDFIAPHLLDSTFLIIGKDPPNWLKSKALQSKNVLLMGDVSNIEDYVVSADVCIAPIRRGSGTRLKLLEYMAAAKPIVSTVIGAEGLPLKTGVNAILCKDVDSKFLDSLNYLLGDEKFASELGLAAKEVADDYSWDKIGKSLYTFYQGVLK